MKIRTREACAWILKKLLVGPLNPDYPAAGFLVSANERSRYLLGVLSIAQEFTHNYMIWQHKPFASDSLLSELQTAITDHLRPLSVAIELGDISIDADETATILRMFNAECREQASDSELFGTRASIDVHASDSTASWWSF
ncbi:MAG: hypothetical protein ACOZE5_01535 [Verrucomicrobiota bacterium]